MIKIAICDDDKEILDYMGRILENHYQSQVKISYYINTAYLLEDWEELGQQSDIVLLDIRFEGDNGILVAQQLQQIKKNVKIIFITAIIEYSKEIFEAQPFYFLVKPVSKTKIIEVVDKAIAMVHEEDENFILLQTKGEIIKVKIDDIWYIESDRRNINIYETGRNIRILKKLDEIEMQLPEYFIRCHQSYLVNMDKIKRLEMKEIELVNGIHIPISKGRYSYTKEKFLRLLGEQLKV